MYKLTYDPKIPGDIKKIGKKEFHQIKTAIEKKLLSKPGIFGKPLRSELVGFWSLRVANYRVIYKIDEKEVFIFHIAHRKSVYQEASKRVVIRP